MSFSLAAAIRTYELPATPWRRRLAYLQDAVLVVVAAAFFYIHIEHVIVLKSFASIFFAADQALLVGLFLFRRRTNTTSTRVWDWVAATIGGWGPLLMRPHETGGSAELVGVGIQAVGLSLVVFATLNIGRSFGVVAANRGLKTGGLYRVVRHPIYAGHAISLAGFITANFWWPNLVLYVVVTSFQLIRIRAEERLLTSTGDYVAYQARVRWRLIPGVY